MRRLHKAHTHGFHPRKAVMNPQAVAILLQLLPGTGPSSTRCKSKWRSVLDSRFVLLPAPLVSGVRTKTRLESSIKQFNRHLIYDWGFRPGAGPVRWGGHHLYRSHAAGPVLCWYGHLATGGGRLAGTPPAFVLKHSSFRNHIFVTGVIFHKYT